MNYATFAAPCLKQLHFCVKETNDFQCKDENIKVAEQLSLKQVTCHRRFSPPPCMLTSFFKWYMDIKRITE